MEPDNTEPPPTPPPVEVPGDADDAAYADFLEAYRPRPDKPPRHWGTALAILIGAIATGVALTAVATGVAQPGPVTNSTSCAVVNADNADGDQLDVANYLNAMFPLPATSMVAVEAQTDVELQEIGPFDQACSQNPDELAVAAWEHAVGTPDTSIPLPSWQG